MKLTTNKQGQRLTRSFFVLLVFLLFSFSCSTPESELIPKQNEVNALAGVAKVKDGILTFQSIADYVSLIDEGTADKKIELTKNLNSIKEYHSLRSLSKNLNRNSGRISRTLSSQEEELIETNDFISTLLNADGLISIGDYFFKINLGTETCFVLPKLFESQLEDLVTENTTNSNIMIFGTGDDVLYLLQEGVKGTQSGRIELFCTQSGASAKDDKGFDYESDRFRMDNKVVYQKVAVYFSLQAKTKVQYKSDVGIWVENSDCNQRLQYYYHIKPKCKSDFEADGILEDDGCGNELNLRPYERSYGINKYWYTTRFYGYSFWSRVYEIRDGY